MTEWTKYHSCDLPCGFYLWIPTLTIAVPNCQENSNGFHPMFFFLHAIKYISFDANSDIICMNTPCHQGIICFHLSVPSCPQHDYIKLVLNYDIFCFQFCNFLWDFLLSDSFCCEALTLTCNVKPYRELTVKLKIKN